MKEFFMPAPNYISAKEIQDTRDVLNATITAFNNVLTAYIYNTQPAITVITTPENQSSTDAVERSVIRTTGISDLIEKYNQLRTYTSCYIHNSNGSYTYGQTIISNNVIGFEADHFDATTQQTLSLPSIRDRISRVSQGSTKSILQIIKDGCDIYLVAVTQVTPGQERIFIENCHSNCHDSCHCRSVN